MKYYLYLLLSAVTIPFRKQCAKKPVRNANIDFLDGISCYIDNEFNPQKLWDLHVILEQQQLQAVTNDFVQCLRDCREQFKEMGIIIDGTMKMIRDLDNFNKEIRRLSDLAASKSHEIREGTYERCGTQSDLF